MNRAYYLESRLLRNAGFRHAFFTRRGGASEDPMFRVDQYLGLVGASRLRPRARRRRMMARPARVFIRARKPERRTRCRLLERRLTFMLILARHAWGVPLVVSR